MNQDEIFIVGANGQLGTALSNEYPSAIAVDSDKLDITDWPAVKSFDWLKTKVIINAAAYTNVDGAESSEGRVAAWNVNAMGIGNLARVCAEHDIILVHISSEYVFDGTKELYTEAEPFSPLSVYGSTKAAGDIAASMAPKYYICRATWLIGEGRNFVRTMISLAQKDISPTVVSDQVGRLTFTSELVSIIDHLLNTQPEYGTYNATNDGAPASWADVARDVFRLGGFSAHVSDTTTEAYFADKPEAAKRPLCSILDLSKLHQTGFKSSDWHEGLETYIKKELAK